MKTKCLSHWLLIGLLLTVAGCSGELPEDSGYGDRSPHESQSTPINELSSVPISRIAANEPVTLSQVAVTKVLTPHFSSGKVTRVIDGDTITVLDQS